MFLFSMITIIAKATVMLVLFFFRIGHNRAYELIKIYMCVSVQ